MKWRQGSFSVNDSDPCSRAAAAGHRLSISEARAEAGMVPERVTKQRASSKTKSHHHGSGLVMQGRSPTRMSEDTPKVPTPPPLLSLPPDEPLINNSKFIGIVSFI